MKVVSTYEAIQGHGQTKSHLLPELNDGRGGVLMVIDGAVPPLKCHTRILNERKDRKTLKSCEENPSSLRYPSYTQASETMLPLRWTSETLQEPFHNGTP